MPLLLRTIYPLLHIQISHWRLIIQDRVTHNLLLFLIFRRIAIVIIIAVLHDIVQNLYLKALSNCRVVLRQYLRLNRVSLMIL